MAIRHLLSRIKFSEQYPKLEGELLELAYMHYCEQHGYFDIKNFLIRFNTTKINNNETNN